MDMKQWVADQIAAEKKKALPVISFPAVQDMGITVADLINSVDRQVEAMKIVADKLDTAASVSFMDLSVEAEAFGSTISVTDEEVPTVIGSIIDEDTDPDDINVPEIGAGRTGLYIEAIRRVVPEITDRPVLAGAIGPFSLAGRLMDVNEIMFMCFDEPELVKAVLDKVTAFIIDYILEFKKVGANGVVLAEPLAGVLSPELLAEFSTPYVRKVVDAVQDDTFAVVYHNCGSCVVDAADSIVATGCAAFHFGNAIKMADVMPKMPADVLVMGNIDPAREIRSGSPESIRKVTLEVMEECCQYPNFVISTGCDVPPMAPWENINAFFAAVEEFYEGK